MCCYLKVEESIDVIDYRSFFLFRTGRKWMILFVFKERCRDNILIINCSLSLVMAVIKDNQNLIAGLVLEYCVFVGDISYLLEQSWLRYE